MSIDTTDGDAADDKKKHRLEDVVDESTLKLKKKKRKHRDDADDTGQHLFICCGVYTPTPGLLIWY